jgi:hypothetical protein
MENSRLALCWIDDCESLGKELALCRLGLKLDEVLYELHHHANI